ncbi:hypothetical protein [Paenibacillus swuensis]|uniref:hypothetical protein n=1 Tax=Paenibacillus swuensis TaxID=1178515 RepID=UPI000A4C6DEA|nr:hypothetical protein [Paenibacillus swuensis]
MATRESDLHGNETINVQLTVKEALALTGTRFNHNPEVSVDAKKKLMKSIEKKLISN